MIKVYHDKILQIKKAVDLSEEKNAQSIAIRLVCKDEIKYFFSGVTTVIVRKQVRFKKVLSY